MDLYQAMKNRRTNYGIQSDSPISDERISEIIKDAVHYTPSAFHSQSSRVVVLYGDKHTKLWSIVLETLRALVPADSFAQTEAKIASFAAGHGTILYLEDTDTIKGLQEAFPGYAENFPVWSMQSAGMLQYAVWTALSAEGLGASLQHYNPIIDDQVKKEFQIKENYKLLAQMPFGTPMSTPSMLEYKEIEDRVRIL